MSEEEKENTEETPVEETPAEETPVAEEAPAEEAVAEEAPAEEPAAEEAPAEERESGAPGPQLSVEEREARRLEERRNKAKQRRKRRADAKAKAPKGPGVGSSVAEKTRTGKPKERQGLVTSNKSDKTITVQIDSARRHPVYEKIVRQRHKIHVHDERNEANEGDLVRVIETRKLSKTKHWRLVEVIEKAR